MAESYEERIREIQAEHRDRYNAELAEWDRLGELGRGLNWVKKAEALMRGQNEL